MWDVGLVSRTVSYVHVVAGYDTYMQVVMHEIMALFRERMGLGDQDLRDLEGNKPGESVSGGE